MAVICRSCKEIKELHEFVKEKKSKSGYASKCKLCHSNYNKKYVVARRKENKKPKEKIIVEKKYCYTCFEEKNICEFTKCHSNLDGHRGKCKTCSNAEANKRNRTRINTNYHKKDLHCFSCQTTKSVMEFSLKGLIRKKTICKKCFNENYKKVNKRVSVKCNITHEEFQSLLRYQNGVCAICKNPETLNRSGALNRLSVDHCHYNGYIRGLLCHSCNVGLGHFRDDPLLLSEAIKYLGESKLKR